MENNDHLIVLGTHSNLELLQGLVDYLQAQNISASIQPDANGWRVQVSRKTAERAHQCWMVFLEEPLHQRYRQASWASNKSLDFSLLGLMSSSFNSRMFQDTGWVTWAVMVICSLVFGVSALGLAADVFGYMKFFEALSVNQLKEFWRWLTPSFLHFSGLHLMLNMAWWWYLGGRLERKLGPIRLFEILIGTSVVACLVQFYWMDSYFGGLSGVVFGLVGYYFIGGYCFKNNLLRIEPLFLVMMCLSLLLGFSGLMNVPVANGAHLGGLLAGMLLALLNLRRDKRARLAAY
ncbi:MAG: rhomboid family intramembrane serine protease [Shewanellaceae bacterium]|nr:rhomboid family intramembrane serine protease [Shewanellaceae bacterium]